MQTKTSEAVTVKGVRLGGGGGHREEAMEERGERERGRRQWRKGGR